MNRAPLVAFCLIGLLGTSGASIAAESLDTTVPSSDSTGPTNPTPPTLPTPGTGVDAGTGTDIEGPDRSPTPGTDGTGRDEQKSTANPAGSSNLPSSKDTQSKSPVPGS